MSDVQMDDTLNRDDRNDRNVIVSLVLWALVAVRSSFIAFVGTIGVTFLAMSVILSGYVLPGIDYGVISGMSFVWGVSALLYAMIGKVLLRLIGYS